MKIVFFGSDEFAATSLARLISDGHDIAAVVTPPDRARGRGMNISFLPVKMTALERLIPTFQPEDLQDKNFQEYFFDIWKDFLKSKPKPRTQQIFKDQ